MPITNRTYFDRTLPYQLDSFINVTTDGFTVPTGVAALVNERAQILNAVSTRLRVSAGTATNIAMSGATGIGYGGIRYGVFPAGSIVLLGARANLTLTPIAPGSGGMTDGASLLVSIGTATAGSSDVALTTTEANIIPSTTLTLGTPYTTAITFAANSGNPALISAPTAESNSIDVFLNAVIADASINADMSVSVAGTIDLHWVNLAQES